MTLFARADPSDQLFRAMLTRFYSGDPDPATDRLLRLAEGQG
jgi:uncharacterized protein (DUF1810 family)